ncbi:hypothetical protein BDQ12DRAFT_712297 [Crucibulum laeve]|uniref:Uncharacterized protein n=1 Tax=Crucibulum laeve TaxID=68775 RepID=A0A5C3M2R3_9AGAR|nr:hypothetical protein BDQ12DRAFT_712297 [Crucibulum laeve]
MSPRQSDFVEIQEGRPRYSQSSPPHQRAYGIQTRRSAYDASTQAPRLPRRTPIPLPVVEYPPILRDILAGEQYRPFPIQGIQQRLPSIIEHVYPLPPMLMISIRFSNRPDDFVMVPFHISHSNVNGGGDVPSVPSVNEVLRAIVRAIGTRQVTRLRTEIEDALSMGLYFDARPGKLRVDHVGRWVWTGFALSREGVYELSII